MTGLLSYLDWFSATLTLSLPQKVARDDPAPVFTTTICMRMRMHERFQTQQILLKVGLGSILIKRLGHPMNMCRDP